MQSAAELQIIETLNEMKQILEKINPEKKDEEPPYNKKRYWCIKDIAAYGSISEKKAREIVLMKGFPSPVNLTKKENAHKRWHNADVENYFLKSRRN